MDHELKPPPISWPDITRLAERHRVESLLHQGLQRRGMPVPQPEADRLRRAAERTATTNLRAIAESARLLDAFRTADLPVLFVKGLTLSQLAHGSATMKMSRDIDLLVRPGDVSASGALLTWLGYRLAPDGGAANLDRWHRWSKESVWCGPNGLIVELHSRLADNPRLLPILRAEMDPQQVTVAPGISLPTLPAHALPAYLAVHGASSAWFRLKWLIDLDALLGSPDEAEVEAIASGMQGLGAGHAGGLALLLLHLVTDVRVGSVLRAQLLGSPRIRWLAHQSLRQMASAAEPTERRGGTLGIHASQLLLGEQAAFPVLEGARRLGEFLFRTVNRG